MGGRSNAGGSGAGCKLGLTTVRPNTANSWNIWQLGGRPHIMLALSADIFSCYYRKLLMLQCTTKYNLKYPTQISVMFPWIKYYNSLALMLGLCRRRSKGQISVWMKATSWRSYTQTTAATASRDNPPTPTWRTTDCQLCSPHSHRCNTAYSLQRFDSKMTTTVNITQLESTGYSALPSPPRLMRRMHTQRDAERHNTFFAC